MSKYFSNIDIWNPTTMRIEFEIAIAKHNAKFARDPKYVNPLDKTIRGESHEYLSGRKMEKYLTPHGDIPTSSEIWRILCCIRTISDSNSMFTDHDIYLLSLFLDEKASIKINDGIDFIKKDAETRCKEKEEEYYTLVYKRLYLLRRQVLSTYLDWQSHGEGLGLRSASVKSLRVFTIKSLDQGIKDFPKEAWEKAIFKDNYCDLRNYL